MKVYDAGFEARSFLVLLILAALSILACDSADVSDASVSDTEQAAGTLELGEKLKDADVVEIIDLASTAISSVNTVIESTVPGALAIDTDIASTSLVQSDHLQPASKYCTVKAEPLAEPSDSFATLQGQTETRLANDNRYYAFKKFHCVLKVADTSESVRGTISGTKEILCVLNKGGALSADVGTATYTAEMDESCMTAKSLSEFREEVGLGSDEKITLSASATILESTNEWDKIAEISSIKIGGNDIGSQIHVKLKNTVNKAAVAMTTLHAADESQLEGLAITMTSTGNLYVETKDYRLSSQGWNRSLRVSLSGEFDAEGNFSSIDDYQGVYGDVHTHMNDTYVHAHSIAGNPEKGFLTESFHANSAEGDHTAVSGYTRLGGEAICLPADKTCEGVESIKLNEEAGVGFFMPYASPSDFGDRKTPATWVKEMEKSLELPSVSFEYIQ